MGQGFAGKYEKKSCKIFFYYLIKPLSVGRFSTMPANACQ